MSKLADKLANLLRLATLKEGEADDEARVNEARTAAFLLVKNCQDNGVKLSFKLPRQPETTSPTPSRAHHPWGNPQRPGTVNDFDDLMNFMKEEYFKKQDSPFRRPRPHEPKPPESNFAYEEKLKREKQEREWKAREQREQYARSRDEYVRKRDPVRDSETAGRNGIELKMDGVRDQRTCHACGRVIFPGQALWSKDTYASGTYVTHFECGPEDLVTLGPDRNGVPRDGEVKFATDRDPAHGSKKVHKHHQVRIDFSVDGDPIPHTSVGVAEVHVQEVRKRRR